MIRNIIHHVTKPVSVNPLVTFRILFGAAMFISTLRFMLLGWVDLHFVDTMVQFKYFGFGWITLLPVHVMYGLHVLMLLTSIGILTGAYYRLSAILFFLAFSWCELIDITYYLNHYYFVSLVAFLLCLVPANVSYSVDVWRKPGIHRNSVPAWAVLIFKGQLLIVYFFAGIAKINYDWLINALPLRIWLPANDDIPVVGFLFRYDLTAYVFSWAGMLFDVFVGFFLLRRATRIWAWIVVVFFHAITGYMFQIGVFPLVMIMSTLIFFSETFHIRFQHILQKIFMLPGKSTGEQNHALYYEKPLVNRLLVIFFAAWFSFHLVFPMRYLLYPGNLYWTEEGYRFSWRVMLMEKAGTATFYVTDTITGREGVVNNADFLNPHQEKQMAMQADLVLQYAQFLKRHYEERGMRINKIRAEVYVTLNARPSRLLISDTVNLLTLEDGWKHKNWILPFENE